MGTIQISDQMPGHGGTPAAIAGGGGTVDADAAAGIALAPVADRGVLVTGANRGVNQYPADSDAGRVLDVGGSGYFADGARTRYIDVNEYDGYITFSWLSPRLVGNPGVVIPFENGAGDHLGSFGFYAEANGGSFWNVRTAAGADASTIAHDTTGNIAITPKAGKSLSVANLPTSAAGLPSGALWRDASVSNVVKAVP